MSLKEVAEAAVAGKFKAAVARTKFRNVKVWVDAASGAVLGPAVPGIAGPPGAIRFDSKHEAARYQALRLEELAGTVRRLERQRPFAITVNDFPVCNYVADFVYEREVPFASGSSWQRVVEDAKGMRTELYRLKKKLLRAALGIEILETRARRKKD